MAVVSQKFAYPDAVVAKMIAERTGARVDYLPNPRNEADENDLHVKNDRFLALGLEPITLGEGLMEEVTDIARKYAHRCDRGRAPWASLRRQGGESAAVLTPANGTASQET